MNEKYTEQRDDDLFKKKMKLSSRRLFFQSILC